VAEDFAVYRPDNMVDAEFSFPYVAAVMMVGKKPGLDWYSVETMSDPEISEIARRIEIKYSEESDRLLTQEDYRNRRVLAEVEVFCADGKRYRGRSELSKRDPSDPLTRAQLLHKFNEIAASAGMSEDRIRETIQVVTGLQTLADVRELGNLLFI
jgi:2-methylcitrate dehydratase PrpD